MVPRKQGKAISPKLNVRQNLYILNIIHTKTNTQHTPPEGGVRTKKFCITFDTIFGFYLPRGTKIGGSWKCRIGAFCTIAKHSGEI